MVVGVLLVALLAAAAPAGAAKGGNGRGKSPNTAASPNTSGSGPNGAANLPNGRRPTAVIALGDSYISGEAGRWSGNSLDDAGSRDGTDRAYVGGPNTPTAGYDASRVYLGGTDANGCHRSDIADVHVTGLRLDRSINLACSGAETVNIVRAVNGGQGQNGEAPQADKLAAIASSVDPEIVVLSIGGNDLGFSDIIIACTVSWFTSPWWWQNHCEPDEQPGVDARMPAAMAGVATAIDEIRAVLAAAGHAPGSYRLVLRSYPSPIPRGSEMRYPESGWSRWDTGGCPFWDDDADWARDSLVPQIAANLRAVAVAKGVEFLDMQDAFQGREVCATARSHVTSSPDGSTHEWVRWLNTGFGQGEAQESLHPNAFGQLAGGRCIGLLAAAAPGAYACVPAGGAGPRDMGLVPG